MYRIFYFALLSLLNITICAPQQAGSKELETDPTTESNLENETPNKEIATIIYNITQKDESNLNNGFYVKIYKFVTEPIVKIIKTPKVNAVLRNIGTCIVNGALELISYYLPPAFMPLIATAAGMVIPFEPVVMLKEKMPVESYRRAFNTAMNSFLRTFDKYKVEDEYDPYMTQRFNRRFMNDNSDKNVV